MPLSISQLSELIEKHAASLRFWIRSRCESPEDVVQVAFCKLAMQEPTPDNPTAWLYRVCRNLADKQRRTDDRRRTRETIWVQSRPTTSPQGKSLEEFETWAAVESLDENLREVLIARLWGHLSLEEIAALCGISTATAFRRYEAAIQSLRSKLLPKCEEHL